jgi:sec-independent protein translocase protein TatC
MSEDSPKPLGDNPSRDPVHAAAKPEDRTMGFFDHLEELRWTLIKSVGVLLIFAVLIAVFLREFNAALLWPLHAAYEGDGTVAPTLVTLGVMEVFNVVVIMCVMGGLGLASPFILFFIGQFVGPALTERERRIILPVCISALVLFLVGSAFSFFILAPSAINVSTFFNDTMGFNPTLQAGRYYSFIIWLVVGVGGTFEFPLVIVLLVWLGLLATSTLRKYRRHAIVGIFVLAAVLTPTQDPINLTLLAAPLYLLFEGAILVGAWVERRKNSQP